MLSTFQIHPIERFGGKNASIKRPKEITCFSYDENRVFRPDDSSLSYYYPPSLGANLSAGFETFRKRDDWVDEHLYGLLDAVSALEESSGSLCEADIITWRGMMTKIMTAPFDMFNRYSK